ncbi:hypothetical protein Taro_038050 [Colocasia esculenta]|uniref:Uncharacterized protein n=1 Tax=Colocasia esculenta TaxID=4460 RepID=A0A843W5N4_COLES|nr:hypothetical protein [Colocasia esculenta]
MVLLRWALRRVAVHGWAVRRRPSCALAMEAESGVKQAVDQPCALGFKGENNPKPKPKIYKAKDKAFHDKHIHRKFFQVHDKASWKLKSRWDGPYTVVKACDNGAVIILDPKTGHSFTVNGQRLKHFFESPLFLKTDSTKLAKPNEA